MKKILYINMLFFLLSIQTIAQENQKLFGKVVTYGDAVPGVYIINKRTGAETITDNNGLFSLEVKTGDELAVYSTKIITRNFTVNKEWFEDTPFIISVDQQVYELEEVVIEHQVTSESLGLVPRGQKRYTPAERRVYTATTGLLDPLINLITGRTKMLKKALETEKQELLIQEVNGMFTDAEIKELNIPEEYVKGFIFYIVEDRDFAAAVKNGDDGLVKYYITELAKKYIQIINEE